MLALPPAEDIWAVGQASVAVGLVTVAVFDDIHNRAANIGSTNRIRLTNLDMTILLLPSLVRRYNFR